MYKEKSKGEIINGSKRPLPLPLTKIITPLLMTDAPMQ